MLITSYSCNLCVGWSVKWEMWPGLCMSERLRDGKWERGREWGVYHYEFLSVSVRQQGNEMKRSFLVTEPLIPPHSDKSQRNTLDLTEQVAPLTVQQIKSSMPLWPKEIKLKSETGRMKLTADLWQEDRKHKFRWETVREERLRRESEWWWGKLCLICVMKYSLPQSD